MNPRDTPVDPTREPTLIGSIPVPEEADFFALIRVAGEGAVSRLVQHLRGMWLAGDTTCPGGSFVCQITPPPGQDLPVVYVSVRLGVGAPATPALPARPAQ